MFELLLVVDQAGVRVDGEHVRVLLRIVGALERELYFAVQAAILVGRVDLQDGRIERGILANRCRNDTLLALLNAGLE